MPREARGRDELAIKLALALTMPDVDVRDVIQRQRSGTMRSLQELTRLKRAADPENDLSWLLVLDSMVFAAEADIRWLDHCETRLARYRPKSAASAHGSSVPISGVEGASEAASAHVVDKR